MNILRDSTPIRRKKELDKLAKDEDVLAQIEEDARNQMMEAINHAGIDTDNSFIKEDGTFDYNAAYDSITRQPSYEDKDYTRLSTTDSSASSDANENTFTKFVEALDKYNQAKNNPFANFGNIGESIAKGISLLDPNGDKALLTEEQKVNYANNNIANLSDENKNKLNEYNNILDELEASRISLTDNFNPEENERFAQNSQRLKDLKASLQQDLNLDDETFNKYVSSSKFLKNLEDRQRQQEEYANASAGEKALANIGDALLAPIRPYVTLKGYLDEKGNPYYDENLGVDHNATGFDMANMNRDITTQATKDIEELTGANEEDASLGNKAANEVLKTLYTGVKSGADSMARLATGEVSTLLGAGLEAADQQYVDAGERGLTKAQAIGTALSSGAAEVVFEKIPVDNMLKLWKNGAEGATKGGVKAAVKDILKQAGIEGMEEVETDIANKFSDAIINKDKSEFNTQVEDYKAQGMDEAEAFGRTLLNNVADTVESFAGGAIGGLVGGVGAIAGSVATTKEAKKLDGNYREVAQAIPDNVEDYNSEEDYNKAMEVKAKAEELDTQDKVSSADRSGLLQDIYAVNETMPNTDLIENINESVNSPFADVGGFQVAKNDITSQQVAQSMAQANNVNDFVEAYRDSQASSDIQARQTGQQYFDTLAPKFDDYNEGSRPLDIAMSQRSAEDIYNAALNNKEVAKEELNTAKKQQLFQRGVAQYNLNRQIEAQRQVRQEESKTVAPEKLHNIETPQGKADIADITMSDDGSFVWKKGEEEVVIPKKDISDNAMKRFMVNATNQPTLSAKQLYVDNYDGSIPIGSYNNAYNSAFNAGKLGHGTFKSWLSAKKFYAKQIPVETLEAFYNEGAKQLKGASKKVTKAKVKGTGKVTVEKGVENTPIHRLAEAIASKTGVDFEIRDGSILVTDSEKNALRDEEGNEIYSNGQFKADVSKVVLGVNDKAYQTLAHEAIGEFLEAYNPEDMQEIQDTILTYLLEEKGDEYVDNTIKRYQRLYQSAEGSKSYRDAANEMVNDTLIGLFTTDKGAKDFVDWCNSNNKKSTLDKIADFIQAIIDKLKSLISDANLSSEARSVAKMSEKQAQKIRDRLFKAMDKAIDNYKGAEEGKASTSTRHSLDVDSIETNNNNILQFDNENLNKEEQTGVFKKVEATRGLPYIWIIAPKYVSNDTWKALAEIEGTDWKNLKDRAVRNNIYYINNSYTQDFLEYLTGEEVEDNTNLADEKAEEAEETFGTTSLWEDTGYLTTNGSQIDLSVKDSGVSYREDHNSISEIMDSNGVDAVYDFLKLGNIRIIPEVSGIELIEEPNSEQYDKLYDYFAYNNGEARVDLSNDKGGGEGTILYREGTSPQRILNDIENYFETGEVPEGTDDGNTYYSLDVDYQQAVEDNDVEKMEELVRQAANNAGFDSPLLYHGTNHFGFTEIDLNRMDDKRTIFLTSNPNIAATYSGTTQQKKISEGLKDNPMEVKTEDLADRLNETIADDGVEREYEYFNAKKRKALHKQNIEYINDVINLVKDIEVTDEYKENVSKSLESLKNLINTKSQEQILSDEDASGKFVTYLWLIANNESPITDNVKDDFLKAELSIRKEQQLNQDVDTDEAILLSELGGYSLEAYTPTEARVLLRKQAGQGIYSLYAKLGKTLEIDGKGFLWNQLIDWTLPYTDQFNMSNTSVEIKGDRVSLMSSNDEIMNVSYTENDRKMSDEELHKDLLMVMPSIVKNLAMRDYGYDTRAVSKFAKDKGYDSVIIKNIRDNGGRNHKIDFDEKADIYMIFNPNNVKSADTVTYDENGDVIPLSERFNTEDNDLRYSLNVDSEGKELTDGQKKYFKNSKIVDKNGNLLVVYHGTPNGNFTVFKYPLNYFTDNKKYASFYQEPSASSSGVRKEKINPTTFEGYLNITKPFDINNADDRRIFIDEYVKGGNALGINPYISDAEIERQISNGIDWNETEYLLDFIQENDYNYDGMIIDEGGYFNEEGSVIDRGKAYVAFNSNQFKNIDNENPTDNEDIRYSLDVPTTYALDEEYSPFIDDDIAETKESKGAFVEIIKAANSTLNYRISDKRIKDIADKVIAQYSSKIDKDFVTKNLRNIFGAMSDNNIEDMSNALINLSEEVIRQSEDIDPYEKENYEDFARNMPTFTLSENQKQEAINIMGDWNTVFAAVGRFLNNDSHTLDGNTYWDICDNALAHGYTMDRDASDTEQLSNIISAIDALTPQSRALFKGADITDASLVTANEIMQQYYDYALKDKQANANLKDVKADLRTQVDDYKKTIGKQYQEQVKRLQKEIKDLKEQQKYANQKGQQLYDRLAKVEKSGDSELVKKLKQENWQLNSDLRQAERMAQRDKKSISRQVEREARNKHLNSIKKQAIRLIKMIDAPTRDKFVPDVIKEQTIEMLQSFDFVTYRVRKNGELVPWGEEKGGEPTKTTQEWHQRMELLQNALNELEEVPKTELVERYGASANYVFNLSVQMGDVTKGLLDQFLEETKDSKVRLSTLKSDKLKILDDFMTSFNATINKAQEAFIDGKNVKLEQIGKDIVFEIGELKALNAIEGSGKKKVLDFLNLDMAEPVTFFSELGETFEKMFWHLAQGKNVRDKHIFDTEDAFAKKKEELGIDKNEPNKWEKGVKSFKNGRLQLTTAQIMSLYAAYQRSQARRHILFGGVMSEDKSLITRKDRKAKRVQNNPVHLTPQDVEEITSTLTEKQKALADFMVEYMSNEVSSWGNRVSQLKWGIKLFTESHYFPIKTYDKTRPSKVQEENGNGSLYALQNQGFTKPLQQDANNALILDDIFSVFADHVAKMAAYDGYVIPISDFMRVYNFAESEEQFVNFGVEEGKHRNDESVKGQIKRVFGKGGNNYVRRFIKNVNEDYGEGGSVSVIDKLFSNNKAQAVLANGRVVIQQPTAYPRAMEVIEGKYLVKALSVAGVGIRRKIQRSKSHNSLAKFKSKGYYETSIGQSMKQMITGTATPKEKINEVSGALAGIMDDFTWSVIYNAAEQKVQAEQPKLEKDSKEYFVAVNKIADEAFIKTQVVDSVFTKSQMMRSRDTGDKMLTAFMAEPTRYYNMLHRGVFNMIQTGDKKMFAKAVYLFVVGQVLNSVAQSIYDAWRDEDDEKNAMEKFLNALIGIDDVAEANGTWATMQAILKTNLFENLLPLNLLPVVKEVTSALAGWDSKNMSTQAIYDIIGDAQKIFNAAEGKGNLTPYGVLNSVAHALSLGTGMPISSALREVKDLYNNLNNLWDGKNIVKTETKQNPVANAFDSGKDIASVANDQKQEKIQKALEEGKTQKEAESSAKSSIASSITSKYKDKLIELKDEDINKANELKQHLLDAYVAIGYSRSDANDKINKWFK